MTSGEGGQGRTCLRAGEIDPVGVAKPCVDGRVIQSTRVAPSAPTLPKTGSGMMYIFAYWVFFLLIVWIIMRRWK